MWLFFSGQVKQREMCYFLVSLLCSCVWGEGLVRGWGGIAECSGSWFEKRCHLYGCTGHRFTSLLCICSTIIYWMSIIGLSFSQVLEMQANRTYPVPPSWNSLSRSSSDSGLNRFSQLSCGRWICKETGDSKTGVTWEKGWKGARGGDERKRGKGSPWGRWLGGTLAGRTSLEFGVRWRSHGWMLCNGSFSHPLLFYLIFWLSWVFVAAGGLSLVVVSRCYSLLLCASFSLWWFLLYSRGSSVSRLQ